MLMTMAVQVESQDLKHQLTLGSKELISSFLCMSITYYVGGARIVRKYFQITNPIFFAAQQW